MIWLEIRCGDRDERDDLQDRDRCMSDMINGPFASAWPVNQANVCEAFRNLMKEAKATGWKKVKGEWICPDCLRQHSNL